MMRPFSKALPQAPTAGDNNLWLGPLILRWTRAAHLLGTA